MGSEGKAESDWKALPLLLLSESGTDAAEHMEANPLPCNAALRLQARVRFSDFSSQENGDDLWRRSLSSTCPVALGRRQPSGSRRNNVGR